MVLKKRVMLLTKPIFFDTDCLSAFLWVNHQSLLVKLYPGRIVIPVQVYTELSYPEVFHLKARIDTMIKKKEVQIASIATDTEEYHLYKKMVDMPDHEHVVIGNGEATAIALAKVQGGIVASNNLKDIQSYVSEFGLELKKTDVILKEAFDAGLITEAEGNKIWQGMLKRRRKLGYSTFTDFLKSS